MPRSKLENLDGQAFDVAVIGAGLNGASAAQHLTAAGYTVLLVDKGDYASGSSSRSTRILSGGIRYLAPGDSMWEFARHPSRLATALSMAKQAMATRSQFVNTTPERARQLTFCFPIYRTDAFKPWQVRLAFKLLDMLGPGDIPLDFEMVPGATATKLPLVKWMRNPEDLTAAALFREYQFQWPERVGIDAVLDAERMGAVVRNYTPVTGMAREGDGRWALTLSDALGEAGEAVVRARTVLNMAGIWIDKVNAMAGAGAGRKITGTKGIHLMVRLPEECRGRAVMGTNRENEHLYCLPWNDLHYFGPTETLYEGDIDGIRPLDEEIDWLIGEVDHLMPGLGFRRGDVLFAWAGVRPLTYDPALPMGARRREIHDLAKDGMPGVLAMTAGPIMTHRSAGRELTDAVAARIKPSGTAQEISYDASSFPENQNSPPLSDDYKEIKLADLRQAAAHEHVTSLIDLLHRRVNTGWTATMAHAAARKAAEEAAKELGWDAARIDQEVKRYHDYLMQQHRVGEGGLYDGRRAVLGEGD